MITVKQISSLEKVRLDSNMKYDEILRTSALRGERFSYQIALKSDTEFIGNLEIKSALSSYINTYFVKNAVMDVPVTLPEGMEDPDYITKEPGLMPDILIPTCERKNIWAPGVGVGAESLWVEVDLPKDIAPDEYEITVTLRAAASGEAIFEKKLTLEVLNATAKGRELVYTRWFYADCIADYHDVEIYSEEHWALVEKYIRAAANDGVNMILVPTHTPPLDTAIGTRRPNVQLVDIKKEGDVYRFFFERFDRFINICKRCGITHFEIAHMFSQWGAKCAPNIVVEENGKKDYMFGWHVAADSKEYTAFLPQYIAALSKRLAELGISENTYFHISDEPVAANIEAYKKAHDMLKPLIGKSKIFDALSDFSFYEKGLVEVPVTRVSHMKSFIGRGVSEQWTYYCCHPEKTYTNVFLALPSQRVRILGVLLYKYSIKGFLQWGLNFYNSRLSLYNIDPYTTTSADGAFASGDAFILYPAKNGAYSSIRAKLTREAISDLDLCRTLEDYIGRDKVVELIDSMAGMDVDFESYPRNKEYLPTLREKMIEIIKNEVTK